MPQLYSYQGQSPRLAGDVYIAPGARIIGDVEIGEGSSVWFNAVLRGDVNFIRIGRKSNIQDNCTVHVDNAGGPPEGCPTILGNCVTVGHNCVLHGCTVEDGCLIGMGAVLLNRCVIGRGSVVGAGALVLEGTVIPPFSLVVGSPAKVRKPLDESSYAERLAHAEHYLEVSRIYAQAEQQTSGN